MKKFPLLKTKNEIPEITLNLTSKVVGREFSRHLRTSWTVEMAQDIGALYHNDINAKAELIAFINKQLYNEIERNLRNFNLARW